jgi:hypothetical protein
MALRPEGPDDWRARAEYARQKAAGAGPDERKSWLAIAQDCDHRANHPCDLTPSAERVRGEISRVEQMAQGSSPEMAETVKELAHEMRDVADTLETLAHRQERKRRR